MNKKALGPVGAILSFLVFLIVWLVWLGSWLNQVGLSVIEENAYTGIEAFFYSNLNFMVLICMILGIMGFMYFGGEA